RFLNLKYPKLGGRRCRRGVAPKASRWCYSKVRHQLFRDLKAPSLHATLPRCSVRPYILKTRKNWSLPPFAAVRSPDLGICAPWKSVPNPYCGHPGSTGKAGFYITYLPNPYRKMVATSERRPFGKPQTSLQAPGKPLDGRVPA